MSGLEALSQQVSDAHPGAVTQSRLYAGELTLTVAPARILDVLAWLQGSGEFKILVDLCGVDWPQREKRFDVVYHLLSLTRNLRVRIKAMVGEGEAIASIIAIYPAAGWFERETFD